MSNSPKCPKCFDGEKLGQSYKVAGKPLFKCRDCGDFHHKDSFQDWEYKWKIDPPMWRTEWKKAGRSLTKPKPKRKDKKVKVK